jgi:glycosyltransferase involved in cell wall biosynthesis
MRIGVNLLKLIPGEIGGMEHYVRNLIRYVSARGGHDLFLYLNANNAGTFSDMPNVTKLVLYDDGDVVRQILNSVRAYSLDLWFCPLLVMEPQVMPIPVVVNIPDVQHVYFPEFFPPPVLEWRRVQYPYSLAHSAAVITLSAHARDTIVQSYPIDPGKVTPIWLDASNHFSAPYDPAVHAEIAARYGLPAGFALFPGKTWPHKNHMVLLRAAVYLRDVHQMKIPLVFTGGKDHYQQVLEAFIRQTGMSDQVKFLGYVPQHEMPYIYRSARFLAFPSLYEGFGIPLVEAMKSGTPILCSNCASIPEIVGDAALYFDPNDPVDVANKILQIQDEDVRRMLAVKGAERGRLFSWERTCEATLNVFESVHQRYAAYSAAGNLRRKKRRRRRLRTRLKRLGRLRRTGGRIRARLRRRRSAARRSSRMRGLRTAARTAARRRGRTARLLARGRSRSILKRGR